MKRLFPILHVEKEFYDSQCVFIINELKIMKQKVLKIFCIIVTIRNSLNEERRRHVTRPASFPFFFRNPAIAV